MCTRNRFQSRQSLDHKRANKSFNWESPPPHHYHPPTTPKTTRPVSWLALSLSQWYKFRVYSVSGDGMCVCGTSMAITLYLCTIDNNKYNLWLPRCLRIPKLPPFCIPSSSSIPSSFAAPSLWSSTKDNNNNNTLTPYTSLQGEFYGRSIYRMCPRTQRIPFQASASVSHWFIKWHWQKNCWVGVWLVGWLGGQINQKAALENVRRHL